MRATWTMVAGAAGVCLLATVSTVVQAGGAGTGPPPQRRPRISVLAGVPGERVEASVDGRVIAPDLHYTDVSDDVPVDEGERVVSLVVVGGAADARRAEVRVTLSDEDEVTVARYLDSNGLPQVRPFPADRSSIGAGEARLTVRHLAALPAVDVRRAGHVVAAGLRSGRTATRTIEPGIAPTDVLLEGQKERLLGAADLRVREGSVTVVSVVGSARGDDLALVVQEVAVEAQPPSPVPSGTAAQPPSPSAGWADPALPRGGAPGGPVEASVAPSAVRGAVPRPTTTEDGVRSGAGQPTVVAPSRAPSAPVTGTSSADRTAAQSSTPGAVRRPGAGGTVRYERAERPGQAHRPDRPHRRPTGPGRTRAPAWARRLGRYSDDAGASRAGPKARDTGPRHGRGHAVGRRR